MTLFTHLLHLLGSSAAAYFTASQIRDPKTRPNLLAGFYFAESGSVPFLTTLSERAAFEGDEWLAEKLRRHADDERRHGQIFAQALKQLNKRVIDIKSIPETTTEGQPQERQRSPFFAAFFEGYSAEDLKPDHIDWLLFMGSTYILELDASRDFQRMANVLPEEDRNSLNLKRGILSIAQDETLHAAYLYKALTRRIPPMQVQSLVNHWRERKTQALWAMVGNLITKPGQMRPLVQEEMAAAAETERAIA